MAAAAVVRRAEGDLTMAHDMRIHIHLKNPFRRRIRSHPDASASVGHPAGIPGRGGHRLQHLAIPIDEPGVSRQIFRFGQVIRSGLRAGELLVANPQSLGRDGNSVRMSGRALEQLGCFRHPGRNPRMSRRFRASPRRGGRRQLCKRGTTSQAQAGARGEEFSLVHQVLHKIPFVRSDISLLPDYIH